MSDWHILGTALLTLGIHAAFLEAIRAEDKELRFFNFLLPAFGGYGCAWLVYYVWFGLPPDVPGGAGSPFRPLPLYLIMGASALAFALLFAVLGRGLRLAREDVKTTVKRVFRRRSPDPLVPTAHRHGGSWIRIVGGCLGVALILWGVGYAITDSIHRQAEEERRRLLDEQRALQRTLHVEVSFDGECFHITNLESEELQNLVAYLHRYPGGAANWYRCEIQRIGIGEACAVRASDFTDLFGERLFLTAHIEIRSMVVTEYSSPGRSAGSERRSAVVLHLAL